jgi:hypothetical protein
MPNCVRKWKRLIAEQRRAKETGDIGAIEKHGVFTGRYAKNPYNGEAVPVWVANYILMDYGTGAIMSVPAHDERDYEFAQKYKLEIRLVILPASTDPEETMAAPELPFTTDRRNSGELRRIQRAGLRRSHRPDVGARRRKGLWQGHRDLPFEGLGHLAAALLGYSDSDGVLRKRWRRARGRKRSADHLAGQRADYSGWGVAAGKCAVILEYNVSEVWRPGSARDRHDGYVRRFVVVFLPLRRCAKCQRSVRFRRRSPTGFPSINTSAASNMPFFTLFIRVSGPSLCATWGS